MIFNYPFIVSGCPKIAFFISNSFRYAKYISGSETNTLLFELTVYKSDYVIGLDYIDIHSLTIGACNETQQIQQDFSRDDILYIKRKSLNPIINANLTLPFVKYVESVIAPTSVTGGGDIITLSSRAYIKSISSSLFPIRNYSVGDIIDVSIEFNTTVVGPLDSYLTLSSEIQPAFYGYYQNHLIFTFLYVVQPFDNINGLTYESQYSLYTPSGTCQFKIISTNDCAPQNLPTPNSNISNTLPNSLSMDLFSPKKLVVSSNPTNVLNVLFEGITVLFGIDNTIGNNYGIPLTPPLQTNVLSRANATVYNNITPYSQYLSSYQNAPATFENTTYECDSSGQSWYYKELIDLVNSYRVIISTGCPNHPFNTSTYTAIPQQNIYYIPLYPVLLSLNQSTSLKCNQQTIGITLNGAIIRSQSSDTISCSSSLTLESSLYDQCGGHLQPDGIYHYHISPLCLVEQMNSRQISNNHDAIYKQNYNHSDQIAWSTDGFPIYGPFGPYGIEMLPCKSNSSHPIYCLDKCNGYESMLNNIDNFQYRYYIPKPPPLGDCIAIIALGNCESTNHPCCSQTKAKSAKIVFSSYTLSCHRGCTYDN